jgi:hypothetical protein
MRLMIPGSLGESIMEGGLPQQEEDCQGLLPPV